MSGEYMAAQMDRLIEGGINERESMCQEIDDLREALTNLLRHAEINTCTHEETHRGGSIWEICDGCGAKWADEKGGEPDFKWPDAIEVARDVLANR